MISLSLPMRVLTEMEIKGANEVLKSIGKYWYPLSP